MRAMILPAALTVLLAGCGFDPAPTAPEDAELPPPEPALDFAPPQLAAAVTNAWATKAPLPVRAGLFRGRRAERPALRRGRRD